MKNEIDKIQVKNLIGLLAMKFSTFSYTYKKYPTGVFFIVLTTQSIKHT